MTRARDIASTAVLDADLGSTVQAYDADTAKYDDATANFTGTLQGSGSNVVVASDIGSTVQAYITPGTSGNVLTSNGSAWTSAAAAAFDAGTRLMFAQTAAPTGWTKDTVNYNEHSLRVTTGAASTGGTVDFTTAFASQAINGSIGNTTAGGSIGNTTAGGSVGSTTLTTSTIPSHRHTRIQAGGVLEVGENTPFNTAYCRSIHYRGGNDFTASPFMTNYTGSSGSHNHSFSGTAHNHSFSGTAHNHSFSGTAVDLAVQYVDVIIATKN